MPIPAVYCSGCREAVLTTALTDRAAAVFAEHGADAWYERDVAEFVPADLRCPECGGAEFERERDILDVWFDSGSSHEGVLGDHPELGWPYTVYLEGSDQYRGWFHSSLLVALGTRGAAPYRQVVTHGFVVDETGRKMSKSIGNTVEPQTIIRQSGAEILRLWVAMVDYREEVRIGPHILDRVVEAYRKIRNTLRILAGNLYDFDPRRARRAAGRAARRGPLRAGPLRRGGGPGARRLRALRAADGGAHRQQLPDGGHQRVLRGHLEGPALHAGGRGPAAAGRRRPRCTRSRGASPGCSPRFCR